MGEETFYTVIYCLEYVSASRILAGVFLNILIIIDIYMAELELTDRCNQNHILKTDLVKLINYLNNYSSYSSGLCLHLLGTVLFKLQRPAPTHWEDLEFTFPRGQI